jgi:SAM-dependent methyltransferase
MQSPLKHVDVGSSVMTLSVISAYIEIEFVDLRPIETNLSGLIPRVGSIVALDFVDDSVASISCLHVIEHIGLGRYGDPLDTLGSVKAATELERVLKPGGRLYLSLPVGRERVCFNAHRVHSPSSVLSMFGKLKLIEFSWVDDAGRFSDNASPHMAEGQDYACGMFVFEKS